MQKANMTPEKIIEEFGRRRRKATLIILLSLPFAIGGFITAAILDPSIGRENAGLVMLGGMVAAFIAIAAGLNIARCPACEKIPSKRITSNHWRVWLFTSRCPKCGAEINHDPL